MFNLLASIFPENVYFGIKQKFTLNIEHVLLMVYSVHHNVEVHKLHKFQGKYEGKSREAKAEQYIGIFCPAMIKDNITNDVSFRHGKNTLYVHFDTGSNLNTYR